MNSKSLLPVAVVVVLLFLQTNIFSQSPHPPPAAYAAGTKVSYVRTCDATAPEKNPNTLITRPLKDVNQTSQYVDGLGRPIETVIMKGSLETATGTNADMVNAVVYDVYGREAIKYLPFAANNTGGNASITDGLFKLNPFQQQSTFYSDINGVLKNQAETFYYSQTKFEPSPLGRVAETFAPGNNWSGTSWDPTVNNHHSTKLNYWVNTATDDVKMWKVTDVANGWGTYSITTTPISYPAGTLMKTITADEKNNQVEEFKDNEGKIILKKVQLTAAADAGSGSGYSGWLCTYYIYDDFNRLRCVIQPKGVQLISTNWILTDATILAEQCFRYEFDIRNRIIRKKVPGAAEVDMVYDSRDRLVMFQDGNLHTAGKWLVTKYDNLNRPIETGLLTDATTPFTTHLSNAYNSTTYPSTASGYEQLTVTHYDNYTGLPSGLSSSMLTTWNSYFAATNNINWPYPQMPAASNATIGAVTWTQTKILGSSPAQFISTASIYDDKSRVVQVQSINATGGTDVATSQYSWRGQPLVMVQVQQKKGINAQTTTLVSQLTYDDLGRVVKTEKKVANTLVNSGTMPSSFKTTSQLHYDKLGQLKTKTLSPTGGVGGIPIETLNYDYNIRGWLLGANRDFVKDATNANYFGFDLGYDKNGSLGTYTPQYNGNISGTIWKSKGDNQKRKYDFSYDAANRLMGADFNQYVSGSGTTAVFDNSAGVDFSVSGLSYDANGNIQAMNQNGLKVTASSPIDQLTYTYLPNTNKLQAVTDASNNNTSKLGDFKYDATTKTATDYTYDLNGNLNLDNNKRISSITYNYLNLPSVITVTGKGSITYIYDAAGNKLQKITSETNATVPYNGTNYTSNITTTTTYIGGLVYESKSYSNASISSLNYTDVLQFIGQDEGRIRFMPVAGAVPASLQYDYFLKDHLGNVRMVLTENQQIDHYPTATLEGVGAGSPVENEKAYYDINNTYVQNQPASLSTSYINDNGTNNTNTFGNRNASSLKMYKLNAATNRTGLGMVLKVMAGDKINVLGKSYYHYNSGGVTNTVLDASALISAFLSIGGTNNVAAAHGATTTLLNANNTGTVIPLNAFSNANPVDGNNNVKAGIAYILFDEQFKYAGGGFDAVDASASGALKSHILPDINVPKNGYIYIYCSNESNIDVFFDNLEVIDTRGPMLEETHYYPFGLTMAGISSKAAGKLENKRKFVSQELDDDLGLNWYQFKFRNHDPQIGRFIEIDPLADKYVYNSTYAYAENRPTSGIDLEGLEFWSMVFNVITDPLNAPSHVSNYIAQKQSDYSESVNATARLSTGTSGEVNHPGGNPMEKSLTKTTGTIQDVNSASKPYTDVYETTNTLASAIPFGEAGLAAGALSKIGATAMREALPSAAATSFRRLETIGGNQASRTVGANVKLINSGESLAPIKVAEINGVKYVLDGHHRLEAGLRTGTDLNYSVVPQTQWSSYGYKSAAEIQSAASEVGRVKLNNKLVEQAAK